MMPKISVSPIEMKKSNAASAAALSPWVTRKAVSPTQEYDDFRQGGVTTSAGYVLITSGTG